MTILGAPISMAGDVSPIVAEMQGRARRSFHKHKKVLCSCAPLKERLQPHQTMVRSAALWGCPAWPVNASLLQAANSTQLLQVRTMIAGKRPPGEPWCEWNIRESALCVRRERYFTSTSMCDGRPTPFALCGTSGATLAVCPHLQLSTCSDGETSRGGGTNKAFLQDPTLEMYVTLATTTRIGTRSATQVPWQAPSGGSPHLIDSGGNTCKQCLSTAMTPHGQAATS